jgi:hypothetical protein
VDTTETSPVLKVFALMSHKFFMAPSIQLLATTKTSLQSIQMKVAMHFPTESFSTWRVFLGL